ncbi:TerD family protein [Streptomyces sp. NPDC001478]
MLPRRRWPTFRWRTSAPTLRASFCRASHGNDKELALRDLSEDTSTETVMIFGELHRYRGEWKFRAVGQGYASGLRGTALDSEATG